MKGYKIFNEDMTCRGFQYNVGETYTYDGDIGVCEAGFHFCENMKDVYNYYGFNCDLPVCVVDAVGEVITKGDKSVTNKIKIIRKIALKTILKELNLILYLGKIIENEKL